MSQYHFIAGLPRSGSTLLAAILRQNPIISAGISSPALNIFQAVQKAASYAAEGAAFIDEKQRAGLLRGVISGCHGETYQIVFDTNRAWPSKMPLLSQIFPDCRIVCCVRDLDWIVDSIERVIAKNPVNTSGLFGFEPGNTVYQRVQSLTQATGLVGLAHNAMKEGYYGLHANRLLLLEYEALVKHPIEAIREVYRFLELSSFSHNFDTVGQVPGAAEYDEKELGTPGMHAVRSRVEWHERETILPPDVFTSLPSPFWRDGFPRCQIVRCQ